MSAPAFVRTVLFAATAFAVGADGLARSPRVTIETRDEILIGRLEAFGPRIGARLSGDSFVRLAPDDLLEIRFVENDPRTRAPSGWLELVDESVVPFDSYAIEADRVTLRVACGGGQAIEADAELSSIAAWSFRGDHRAVERPDANGVDLLLIKPRSGGASRPVEGAIVGLSAEHLTFALDADAPDEAIDVPWARVAGMRFFRGQQSDPSAPACALTLNGGGRVVADRYDVARDGALLWESDHSMGRAPLCSLAAIDLSAGRVAPVAAWRMTSEDRRPTLAARPCAATGYSLGAALNRQPLRLRWPDARAPTLWPDVAVVRTYPCGLAVRGGVALTFGLPADASRLRGAVGIDPSTALVGDALVTILADEREVWSGRVNGQTPPIELNEPLAAPSRLTIRVDEGHNLDTGDHVHFVDLRVIR